MTPDLHKQMTDYVVTINSTIWDAGVKLYEAQTKMAQTMLSTLNVTNAFENTTKKK